ncbi:hypothetical protein HC024_03265 [Methylococcaceae bacterium WWC4]|nr:hypothetical protein [Methylococcaceae bacterium WWC4]
MDVTVTGKIFTDGTTGLLQAGNITGWNIQMTKIAKDIFTPSTSIQAVSGLTNTGTALTINHDPNDPTCCGTASFLKGPFPHFSTAISLADFNTGINQASYSSRVGEIPSGVSTITSTDPAYPVASIDAAGSNQFSIKPIDFGSGVTAFGSITTASNRSAQITDWNITVQLTENTVWNQANSVISGNFNNVSVSADGKSLLVGTGADINDPNGSGFFGVDKGRIDILGLADFFVFAGSEGNAFYMPNFNSIGYNQGPLTNPTANQYVLASAAPVPLPAGVWLFSTGLGLILANRRKNA